MMTVNRSKTLIAITAILGMIVAVGLSQTRNATALQVDCQLCDADWFLVPPGWQHIFAGSGELYAANIHYDYKPGDCYGGSKCSHVNCRPERMEQLYQSTAGMTPEELAQFVQANAHTVVLSKRRNALLFYEDCSVGKVVASRHLTGDEMSVLTSLD